MISLREMRTPVEIIEQILEFRVKNDIGLLFSTNNYGLPERGKLFARSELNIEKR